MPLSELRKKHLVDGAVFLVDETPWLQAALYHHGLRFQHETHEIGTLSNVSSGN
jgi:transposase-like protein